MYHILIFRDADEQRSFHLIRSNIQFIFVYRIMVKAFIINDLNFFSPKDKIYIWCLIVVTDLEPKFILLGTIKLSQWWETLVITARTIPQELQSWERTIPTRENEYTQSFCWRIAQCLRIELGNITDWVWILDPEHSI